MRLVHGPVPFKAMTKEKEILKFDTGADGFLKMILVLGALSVLVLGLGIYFLVTTF